MHTYVHIHIGAQMLGGLNAILFYCLRAFQYFLQISKIQTLSRVMSKKQQNSTFSKSFIIQKQYEESF